MSQRVLLSAKITQTGPTRIKFGFEGVQKHGAILGARKQSLLSMRKFVSGAKGCCMINALKVTEVLPEAHRARNHLKPRLSDQMLESGTVKAQKLHLASVRDAQNQITTQAPSQSATECKNLGKRTICALRSSTLNKSYPGFPDESTFVKLPLKRTPGVPAFNKTRVRVHRTDPPLPLPLPLLPFFLPPLAPTQTPLGKTIGAPKMTTSFSASNAS